MGYLFLSVACAVLIGHLFKYREKQGLPIYPILMTNYVVAIVLSIMRSDHFSLSGMSLGASFLAVLLGTLFVFCYALMNLAIPRLGVSITVSLGRLSLVIPTLCSILLFSESVDWKQTIGLVLALAIIPLSGEEIPDRQNLRRLVHGGLGWALVLFFFFGMNDLIFKLKSEFYLSLDTNSFLFVVYIISLLFSILWIRIRKNRITPRTILLGVILGLVNYHAAVFFMKAVELLPGMIAYPLNGISIIVLTSITSAFVWREKLKAHNYLFLGGSLIAIWLLF